jgi:hypothetical protein
MKARHGSLAEAASFIAESQKAAPDDQRVLEEQIVIRRAHGQHEIASAQAGDLLKHFPTSDLLLEEAGRPNLQHLAADPYRVIRIASQYAGLGLLQNLGILSRSIRPSPRPGRTRNNIATEESLVLYTLRLLSREVGRSRANDYALASLLSTLCFPSTQEEKLALKRRYSKSTGCNRAFSPRYVVFRALKTETFCDGKRRDSWARAFALEASLGLALLHEMHDFPGAVDAFKKGNNNDQKHRNYWRRCR